MTNVTMYVFGLYQLTMVIRDAVGYLTPHGDKKLSREAYERRVKTFEVLTGEGSPFAHFVSINKEQSEKLLSNLEEFKNDVYSSKSTIFRVSGDFVEVDAAQHIRVYDMTLGIFQTFSDILQGYLKFGENNPDFDKRMVDVINAEEYYFRALAHYALAADLIKLFREYSEARSKDQSADNPIAKFINEDIMKLVSFINFLEKHNKVKNLTYKTMTDGVKAFIENISGRRELPAGKTFPNVFEDLHNLTLHTLQDAEGKWKDIFLPLAKDHHTEIQKHERKNPEDLA